MRVAPAIPARMVMLPGRLGPSLYLAASGSAFPGQRSRGCTRCGGRLYISGVSLVHKSPPDDGISPVFAAWREL